MNLDETSEAQPLRAGEIRDESRQVQESQESQAGGPAPGALAGIKVVDLTRVLGGPYCTQILGDHGAEVLKVEAPQGDETRSWGPPFEGDTASYFIAASRASAQMGRSAACRVTTP